MNIILVAGARPNFMKIAPLMEAMRKQPAIRPMLVHTGQHYDEAMSDLFFRQLDIPEPDINLEVGSGSHAVQTAEIMKRFEQVLLKQHADCVLVVGDVNSTIACGLVAVKMGVKLVHVEAGLRSFDRSMPEEVNRILTDSISDLLFCSEQSGVDNLRREGIPIDTIHFVGNVMIDTLISHRAAAQKSTVLADLGLKPKDYSVLTLHRPSNVDDAATLGRLIQTLIQISKDMPIVFPIHPRTRQRLASGLPDCESIFLQANWRVTEPLGYLEFLKLMSEARLVLTDSGGIQEESTVLNVPCLTLRESTERPVTIALGTNHLVGTDPDRILRAYREVISGNARPHHIPPGWDGHAAERIVKVIEASFC